MKTRGGVNVKDLKVVMNKALVIAEKVYHAYNEEVIVTCGVSDDESKRVFHKIGLAVDIVRPKNKDTYIFITLQIHLGSDYLVTRIHSYYHIAYIGTVRGDLEAEA